jgi:transposase
MFVGIDVAKDTLAIAVRPTGEAWTTATDPEAVAALVARIASLSPARVVLEATGGLERRLAAALADAGLPVVVANPEQVRDFARGLGTRAKTDPIDARVLARFAEVVQPPVRPLASPAERELEALVTRRRQLIELRTIQKNQQRTAAAAVVDRSFTALLALLEAEIDRLTAEITDRITLDPTWRAKAAILQSVPGVGEVSTMTLLAELPELGTLGRAQIASLAGVAPFTRQSGATRKRARIAGGRANLRTALYMPVITAKKHNPVIKAFYDRLIAAGKPTKVALIACQRRLITILNAMLRDGTTWQHRPLSA